MEEEEEEEYQHQTKRQHILTVDLERSNDAYGDRDIADYVLAAHAIHVGVIKVLIRKSRQSKFFGGWVLRRG